MEYKPKHMLQGQHKSPIACLEFCPTGLRVASGDLDGFLILSTVDGGNILWRCRGHAALLTVRWVRSTAGKEHIFCGYMDGTMVIIDLVQEGLSIMAYRALNSPIECLALQETFHFLALGGGSEITVWSAKACTCNDHFLTLMKLILHAAPTIRRVCTLPAPKSSIGTVNVKVMTTSIHWKGDALIASYLFHGIM